MTGAAKSFQPSFGETIESLYDCGLELSRVVAVEGDEGASSYVEEDDLSEVVRLVSVVWSMPGEGNSLSIRPRFFGGACPRSRGADECLEWFASSLDDTDSLWLRISALTAGDSAAPCDDGRVVVAVLAAWLPLEEGRNCSLRFIPSGLSASRRDLSMLSSGDRSSSEGGRYVSLMKLK
jgi:hypothetical protein